MKPSMRAAFCGILTALAVVFLLLVPVIPVLLYCSPMLAGICVALSAEEFGARYSIGVYAAASVLSALLAADKEAVSVFILLSGAYPILRYILREKNFSLRLAAKLAYINAACIGYYFTAVFILGIPRDSFGSSIVMAGFLIMGNLIMLVYDRAIGNLIEAYKIKLRKRILRGRL